MRASINREEILDEALHVFGRMGFRKAAISDIVRPLGVGKTAIYHYFPGGKNEVIDACLAREEDSVLTKMRDAEKSSSDPRVQLRAVIFAKFEHIQRLRSVFKITGEVGHEISQLYRLHQRRFIQEEESLIEIILRQGQQMGVFRPGSTQRLARSLRGIFARYEFEIAFETEDQELHDQIDNVFDLIFYGMVVTNSEGGLS